MTVVHHPKELAWIVVKSKKKNDKADSLKKIAKLHMSGMLPESHLLDPEEQVKRDPSLYSVWRWAMRLAG